jgi:hypothetical protein
MKIKTYLDSVSILPSDFAKKCQMSKTCLSRYINGKRVPTLQIYLDMKIASKGKITEFDYILDDVIKSLKEIGITFQ